MSESEFDQGVVVDIDHPSQVWAQDETGAALTVEGARRFAERANRSRLEQYRTFRAYKLVPADEEETTR